MMRREKIYQRAIDSIKGLRSHDSAHAAVLAVKYAEQCEEELRIDAQRNAHCFTWYQTMERAGKDVVLFGVLANGTRIQIGEYPDIDTANEIIRALGG